MLSGSVVSDSLRLHGLQQTRLPCPSPSPRDCSNSCSSSPWCHPTIWSSVAPFLLPSVFPSISLFQVSRLFASDGQSIGASTWASFLPMNILAWFPLGFTGLISLRSKGLSGVFTNTTVQKHQFFSTQELVEPNIWFPRKLSLSESKSHILSRTGPVQPPGYTVTLQGWTQSLKRIKFFCYFPASSPLRVTSWRLD